jgi:hypothetical protein
MERTGKCCTPRKKGRKTIRREQRECGGGRGGTMGKRKAGRDGRTQGKDVKVKVKWWMKEG